MRFNINDYEKAFPRKAEPMAVRIEADEKIDSVIEGSSEDSETLSPDTKEDIKIYTGPEKPSVIDAEGGDEGNGNE